MNWFRDRSVTTKLLLLSAAVCGVAAASGLLSYRGLTRSREAMRTLYADYTVAGTDLAKSAVNLARFRNNIVLAANAKDKAAADRALDAQPALRANVLGALDAYAATTLRTARSGRDERKDLDRLRAAANDYFAAAERTMQATAEFHAAGDKEREPRRQQMAEAMAAAGPKFDALTVALDEMIKTCLDSAQDVNEDGDATAAAAQWTLAGGTAAAVLLAVTLGLVIARSVARPLGRTVAAIEALARGELTRTADVTSADEVGRMAQSLNAALAGIRAALDQEKVDWAAVGRQRLVNADFAGQIAAIGRAQAVVEFNMDGTVVTANDHFVSVMGYTLAEIQGKHHSLFCDPAHVASPEYREFWARLNRGESAAEQFRRLGKGGKEVWIEASYNPILGLDGKPYKVVKFATDATDRVKAARLAEYLSLVANNTDNSVVITDARGLTEYVNPGFTRLTGYTFEDIKGKKPGELLQGPLSDPATRKRIHDKLARREPVVEEIFNYTKSGVGYWIALVINPVLDDKGNVTKFVAVQSNVDATKRAQIETAARMDAIGRTQAVVEFNTDGTVVTANDNFVGVMGYTLAEIQGKHHSLFCDPAHVAS
ncbi:MAG: PAS domain S-box protein, partial [Gemmataceae bacterium]|nr:PAS domain S-box protein [Gemmataceae bacterium]